MPFSPPFTGGNEPKAARPPDGYRQCGKLIVAAGQGETEILWEYEAHARESGAGALERLSSTKVTTLEPQVRRVEDAGGDST